MGRKAVGLSRPACLGMLVAAIETFPKECMGMVFSKAPGSAWFAIPYQIAHRSSGSVTSFSSSKASMICGRSISTLAEFHSHPYDSSEHIQALEPSYQDIKDIKKGSIEIIIRIYGVGRKSNRRIYERNGEIHAAVGKFRFLVKAFVKTSSPRSHKAFDSCPEMYYNRVDLRLMR